jgi:hypothetical protein
VRFGRAPCSPEASGWPQGEDGTDLHPEVRTVVGRMLSGVWLTDAHRRGGDGRGRGADPIARRKSKPEFKRRVVEEWLSGDQRIARTCRMTNGQ